MAKGKRTLQIVNPCPAAWNDMRGTAERRHCDQCNKTVHDLSALTPEAAAELLEREDPVCVRVRCSPDGTVLHSEAPARGGARPRLQLLVTPALLAAMAACRAPTDAELVVEGPHASGSSAYVVAPPASAPAAAPSERIAHAEPPMIVRPQPPTPGDFLTGVTVALDKPGPVAPKQTKPRHTKAARPGGTNLAPTPHGTKQHPEHQSPDWLLERNRQPRQESATGLECMGLCI